MKYLLKNIPGFRTGRIWKMIIALIYYGISLMFLKKTGFCVFLIMASIPFIIFAIISMIMEEKKKHFLITLICAILILSVGIKLDMTQIRNAVTTITTTQTTPSSIVKTKK
jgi:hypothetical protein